METTAIEMQALSCYYKNKKEYVTALSHIDLCIESGELLVVVGESGSGKSTLIKACLGMAEFYEGELFIDGEDVESIDFKSGKYAYVSQEYALYPNLTIYENIAFPLRMMHTPHEEVDRRVKEIAELIGMRQLLTRKPKQLSGGQQQRVAIGRTLVKNPQYIFLDEPFSNVDISLRADLRRLLKMIHERYGQTIVFVTHDLTEAFNLADRIAVLEEGKLIELGTPEELEKAPRSELLKIYFGVAR